MDWTARRCEQDILIDFLSASIVQPYYFDFS